MSGFAAETRYRTIAFLAAAVFVLQSLLMAWAAGAMPIQPDLDAFGNPLCITSVDRDTQSPVKDHSTMLDCCTLGCSMGSSVLASAPEADVGLLRPLVRSDILFACRETIRVRTPDHDPGSPRAPPLTV
ncbi:MAG: hypothetical protein NTV73_06920 [Hyphomicrobiales bacterium]|nr:hypothetical protein [Hyphomicrobiales bacterium]